MKIQIDRFTNKVTGIDTPVLPGGFEITVPEDFNCTKTITRIQGERQKANGTGQLLYKTNIGQEEWDETTESRIATIYEEQEVITTDQDGNETTQMVRVPVEWEDLQPVMILNEVPETIQFKDYPFEFTLDEVVAEKYRQALEESSCTNIVADVFLDENDLDLSDPNHSANTGVGILQLLPGGQAKTKAIMLDQAASTFRLLEFDADQGVEIYLAGQKFVNGALQLTTAMASCTIKFVNTTDKPKSVRAYAVGY